MSALTGLVADVTAQAAALAREYAEGNMIATVKVTRPTKPVFDRVTGGLAAMSDDADIYTGIGRVYNVTGPAQMNFGDEPQYFSTTYISIPLSATKPRIDDVVEVLTHPDAHIVGRTFRVQDVESGGQLPVCQRMQVVGIQASREWTEA